MIPPTWSWYRQALAKPHEAYSRVEVWRSGVMVTELAYQMPNPNRYTPVFLDGSVRATLASRVSRVLTLTVPDYLFPWDETDLLAPFGNELRAYRGIRYGSGAVDEFMIFRGPIMEARPAQGGRLTVQAADRGALVAAAGFFSPLPSQAGDPISTEVKRVILDAVPDAEFGTFDDFDEVTPELAYDDDRGAALDALGKAVSAYWYALADGRFVLRRVPWTRPVATSFLPLTDGAGGTLLSAYPNRTAAGIFNQVTVTSERPDGGEALFASAQDLDPTSATYVAGPFGVRSTQIRLTTAVAQVQLLALAQSVVKRSRARTTAWQITCVPDGSIELGDPLELTFRSRPARQLVAGFTMPLDPAGTMSIDGRDLIDTDVSG